MTAARSGDPESDEPDDRRAETDRHKVPPFGQDRQPRWMSDLGRGGRLTKATKSKRVGDDAHAGHRHRAGGERGVQQNAEEREEGAGGYRYQDHVVDEGPEQILA